MFKRRYRDAPQPGNVDPWAEAKAEATRLPSNDRSAVWVNQ
jgi:hypothetical protein